MHSLEPEEEDFLILISDTIISLYSLKSNGDLIAEDKIEFVEDPNQTAILAEINNNKLLAYHNSQLYIYEIIHL